MSAVEEASKRLAVVRDLAIGPAVADCGREVGNCWVECGWNGCRGCTLLHQRLMEIFRSCCTSVTLSSSDLPINSRSAATEALVEGIERGLKTKGRMESLSLG